MKRTIAILLSLLLLVASATALVACNPDNEQFYWGEGKEVASSDKTEIVYLGDSIAEGILGASPLSLRHEYAYANVIGRRNDFTYYNHSVSGHLTDDMLALISNEEGYDGARGLISHIKTADVLHISILGNDVLQDRPDVVLTDNPYGEYVSMHQVVCDAMIGNDYDGLNIALYGDAAGEGRGGSYGYVIQIIDRLIELNPDAVIIFQKIYNPIANVDTPLVKANTRATLDAARVEVTLDSLHELGNNLIGRMNALLQKAVDEFNAAKTAEDKWTLTTVDGLAAFNKIYDEKGADAAWDLIYPDGIHPSDEGHAVLADLTQAKLEELGLVNSAEALLRYKMMRVNFLFDEFEGKLDNKWEAAAKIMSATSCAEVTDIFFRATEGVTPDYSIDHSAPVQSDTVVETQFRIDTVNTSVWGMPGSTIGGLLDLEKSGIFLRSDGTMSLRLILNETASSTINGMLGELLTGGTVDLSSFEETYLEPIAPGASLDDINALLDTAYDCLGLKLIGYDPANPDPGIAALIEGLENGRLPESLSIPAGFGVELNYNYTMKKVQSANGTVYDAVYLTPYDGDTQPFIVMTMGSKTYDMNPNVAPDDPSADLYKTDGPKTARTLTFMVDFIKLQFSAIENVDGLFVDPFA